MRILHLTQQKKWFDMIAAGIKKEEYRELNTYWAARLLKIPASVRSAPLFPVDTSGFEYREYDIVQSKNGYARNAPTVRWEHAGVTVGTPNPEWCPAEFHGQRFFILHIGKLIL